MFTRKSFVVFLAGAMLLAACGSAPATEAAPVQQLVASLTELQGGVGIKAAGTNDFVPAQVGMTLNVNGVVRTESDGRARLDLSSGTIVRVAPASVFTLVSNEPQADQSLATKIKLELGQIFIVLNGGSVEVETPSGQASVRGSYMMVKIDPETKTVTVTCLEGDCKAKTRLGNLDFAAGQVAVLTFGDFPPVLGEMSLDDFEEWLSNVPEAIDIISIATATSTGRETPTGAAIPTGTIPPASTPTATPTLATCSALLMPSDGASFDAYGKVTFSWSVFSGAATYNIRFTDSNGIVSKLTKTDTSLVLYIENLPVGGNYTWQVLPLDSNGNVLCESQLFTFSKLVSPTLAPSPAPVIIHNTTFTLVGIGMASCNYISLDVDITDPDGVNQNSVFVVYRVNTGAYESSQMIFSSGFYSGAASPSTLTTFGDVVSYYFQATDLAGDTSVGGGGTVNCP